MRFFNHRSPVIGLILFIGVFTLQMMPLDAVQTAKTPAKKVNINTASSEELQTIPRIGPSIARRIIEFREQNGPFKRVEDLMKVRGIGEKTFQMIKDLITVDEVFSSAVYASGKGMRSVSKTGRQD